MNTKKSDREVVVTATSGEVFTFLAPVHIAMFRNGEFATVGETTAMKMSAPAPRAHTDAEIEEAVTELAAASKHYGVMLSTNGDLFLATTQVNTAQDRLRAIMRSAPAAPESSQLREAAQALATQLRAVVNSPDFTGMFVFAHIHNNPYKGPQFGVQLDALEAALAASPEQPAAPDADPFPATGLEPRGCPTPGACSCPPDADGKLRELQAWATNEANTLRKTTPMAFTYGEGAADAYVSCANRIDALLATPTPADAKPSEDIAALRQQVADLTRERDEFRDNAIAFQDDGHELRAGINEKDAEIARLREERDADTAMLNEAHDAIARASERMRAQDAEIARLRAELDTVGYVKRHDNLLAEVQRLRAGQNERAVEELRWAVTVIPSGSRRTIQTIRDRIAALTKASEQEPAVAQELAQRDGDEALREFMRDLNDQRARGWGSSPHGKALEELCRRALRQGGGT